MPLTRDFKETIQERRVETPASAQRFYKNSSRPCSRERWKPARLFCGIISTQRSPNGLQARLGLRLLSRT